MRSTTTPLIDHRSPNYRLKVIESSASTTRTPSLPSVFSRYDLQLPDDVVTHLESADVGRVLGVSYQRAHQLAQ